jgi:hypothetical protein
MIKLQKGDTMTKDNKTNNKNNKKQEDKKTNNSSTKKSSRKPFTQDEIRRTIASLY